MNKKYDLVNIDGEVCKIKRFTLGDIAYTWDDDNEGCDDGYYDCGCKEDDGCNCNFGPDNCRRIICPLNNCNGSVRRYGEYGEELSCDSPTCKFESTMEKSFGGEPMYFPNII